MERNVARAFEALLILIVLASVGFGVTQVGGKQLAPTLPAQSSSSASSLLSSSQNQDTQAALPLQPAQVQSPGQAVVPGGATLTPAASDATSASALVTATPAPTAVAPVSPAAPGPGTGAAMAPATVAATPLPNVEAIATPVRVELGVNASQIAPGDAPLIDQSKDTVNILVLGTDASLTDHTARTDTIMVASINPAVPSVSLLSIPRDLLVKFPDGHVDRVNTAYELGYMGNYPGGGPAFLALVLRKNYGIVVHHYAQIDFAGFIKAVDALGGVDVLVECELHESFPDKESPHGRLDLDFYPGKMTLNGKAALGYARARYSTTDFDRARRQQKVIRGILRKARAGNLFQNALSLYGEFRQNLETDLGPTDLPWLIDVAQRLDNISIKTNVITWPIITSVNRGDGAAVLGATPKTIPFITMALAPPSTNQANTRPAVEVYNASSRSDMELVAAERLASEGFQVTDAGVLDGPKSKQTQIFNFSTSPKNSPIARLQSIFKVTNAAVFAQPDPSSTAKARIVLGENYSSCPNTATIAGDAALTVQPTVTAGP